MFAIPQTSGTQRPTPGYTHHANRPSGVCLDSGLREVGMDWCFFCYQQQLFAYCVLYKYTPEHSKLFPLLWVDFNVYLFCGYRYDFAATNNQLLVPTPFINQHNLWTGNVLLEGDSHW